MRSMILRVHALIKSATCDQNGHGTPKELIEIKNPPKKTGGLFMTHPQGTLQASCALVLPKVKTTFLARCY